MVTIGYLCMGLGVIYGYVIVIPCMVVGIHGSKPTEPEGEAPRARWVYEHNIWASYDTLEKTIIQRFATKASVKRKCLKMLRPSHCAMPAHGLMRRIICGKPYMCNCVLRNATWS